MLVPLSKYTCIPAIGGGAQEQQQTGGGNVQKKSTNILARCIPSPGFHAITDRLLDMKQDWVQPIFNSSRYSDPNIFRSVSSLDGHREP